MGGAAAADGGRRRVAVRRAAWLALALSAALGCRGSEAPAAAAGQGPRRYTVRAEVVGLPASPGGELSLRHEAVDDFADASGKVVGMDSMTMPFPVEKGVSLDGVAAGAKVEVILAVDWARGAYRIEALKRLPPDTVLRFGKAQPAGAAAGSK